jgi:hypothetical protein
VGESNEEGPGVTVKKFEEEVSDFLGVIKPSERGKRETRAKSGRE